MCTFLSANNIFFPLFSPPLGYFIYLPFDSCFIVFMMDLCLYSFMYSFAYSYLLRIFRDISWNGSGGISRPLRSTDNSRDLISATPRGASGSSINSPSSNDPSGSISSGSWGFMFSSQYSFKMSRLTNFFRVSGVR